MGSGCLGWPRWVTTAVCLGLGIAVVGRADARRTPAEPVVRARAAVVMDAATGELIYAKLPDQRLPPASTTKVMTAVLALESGRLDESTTVSQFAAAVQPSKLHLRAGDRARLRDLMYAVLLKSANDASVTVAEALGGSVRGFASRMNRRAAQVGARNTHFLNPNGLPARGHYSTARDLALIFRHALEVPHFRQMAATREARVTAWRRSRRRTFLVRNTNRLLTSYRMQVIGKTGYTREAKRCFVGAAGPEGREVIIALLGSTDVWGDARHLLDFGLSAAAASNRREVKSRVSPAAGPQNRVFTLTRSHRNAAANEPVGLNQYSLFLTPAQNSRDAAERLRHFVDRRGLYAVVEAAGPPHERRYHVRVLGLPTRQAALRAHTRLRAEHLQPTIVPPG